MNFELIKKHPVAAGAVVLFGAVVLYALMKHGAPASSSSSPDLSGANAQLAYIQSGQAAIDSQTNASVEMAQLSAQVATAQTNAQLAAVQVEAKSAENIVTTQTQGATDIASINADATTQQTQINADAKTAIASTVVNAQLEAAQAQIDAEKSAQQHSFDLASSVITSAGTDKSRSSTGWAQIIAAIEGQGPQAIAANQPSNVANSVPNIIGTIGSVISKFF